MLSLDIETYSEVNLSKSGVYAYADSPTFQVLLLAFAFDEEPVQVIDLLSGEPLPARVNDALLSDQVPKAAFNSAFERVCLSRHLGVPLSPLSWHCTAVQAAMLALPQSLEGVGEVLNIKRKKLKEGSDLVRYFCIPCKPTKVNGGRRRNLPQHAPDKWSSFKAYCQRDVEAEREIRQRLAKHPVNEKEQALYCLDQEINDRGILVDPVLVQEAIHIDKRFQVEASAKAYALTGLHNPNSVSQMKEWLSDMGVTTGSLDKKAVNSLIQESAGEVLEMLKLRLLMAKTSVRKYEAIQRSVCADGRVHGLLQFYGANRTGRWAGRLVQVQNLPANHMPDLDSARQFVRQGQYEALDILYPSIPNVLSELIRTAFIPKPGSRFIVADFSAIEARVIAWLAGESWRLEVFQTHGKIYEASASAMFGVAIDEITKGSPLRQKGKVAELACIAEGSLVLTDKGLVPIEQVTTHMKLWDGDDWVNHEGVIDQGIKEVMTYDGLCATADHLVYLKGEPWPVQLGKAAQLGAALQQSGQPSQQEPLTPASGKARVYDIKNAGPRHRFTVSSRLVHNCGYGGSVGALKAMGALEMGLNEEDLEPLIKQWRAANPRIVQFWWDCDAAAMKAVREQTTTQVGRVRFQYSAGFLFITLPSGRRLAYARPRFAQNQFGREGLTYQGVGESRKWLRMDTYGPKLVENIVQATARDLLAEAMLRLDQAGYRIVMHCHDEVVIEAPNHQGSVEEVCQLMAIAPSWADGLPLNADGYQCAFYKKE